MQTLKYNLNKNIVISKFSQIDLSRLCQYVTEKKFKSGDKIFSINDDINDYYLIKSGSVDIISESGQVNHIYENESFGDEGIIGFNFAISNAVANSNCEVILINKEFIANAESFQQEKKWAYNNLLRNIGKKYDIESEKIKSKSANYSASVFGWTMSVIMPILAIYGLSLLDYPPTKTQSLLIYIFLSALSMWTFKLVPEFVPALYLLLGMVLLSLAPSGVVLSGFYSDAFFLAISLSILGVIISISGLSYRVLLHLFRFGSNSGAWRHFALFLSGALITPVIPSANGRVNILYPLFGETLSLYKIKKGTLEYQRLVASTLGGISLLSPIFLTSKSINLLALGMLSTQDQYNFQFYYWFVSASVVGIVMLLFYAFFSWFLFRNDQVNTINVDFLKIQLDILGRISTEEIFAIISILLFAVIVFTSSIHNLQVSWLAMLLAIFLFILGVLKRQNFNHSIDWDFLIFLSSLLGFANTMSYLGLDVWINHYTGWIVDIMDSHFIEFIAILAVVTFILRLFLPINIAVILLASILIPVAGNTNISPWLVVFIVLLFSESYTYNFSASYVMQFISLANDVKVYPRLILLQIIIYIVKFIAIIISIPFWIYLGILVV